MKPAVFVSLVALLSCRASAPPIRTYDFSRGEQVIQAMRDRYVNRWYRTLTYVQHNRGTGSNGDSVRSVWLTAYLLPSRMRIDYGPLERGDGVLVLRDTQYVMRDGVATDYIPRPNPLLLLGHDVYYLPVSVTLDRLRRLGFDTSRSREDRWMNRPVLVVGAAAGDNESPQFWVDREHLVLVRLIDPSGAASGIGSDIRLLDFESLGRSWVPRRLKIYDDAGRLVSTAELRQVRSELELDSTLFMITGWETGIHWYDVKPEPFRTRNPNTTCC